MEPLSRKEIKDLFNEAIAPFITEVRLSHDSLNKDIQRLFGQSAEHYANIKAIDDKVSSQIAACQTGNFKSQENSGIRTGKMEKDIARIDQKIEDIEADITEMKENKKFNVSQWLVVAGIIVVIIFEIIPHV